MRASAISLSSLCIVVVVGVCYVNSDDIHLVAQLTNFETKKHNKSGSDIVAFSNPNIQNACLH